MPDLSLGFAIDADGASTTDVVSVGSSDLTTHGVVVGMTGSGKTGLGIGLVEQALLAGIPVVAIDPKGDLGNLCLTFPDLAPASFRPWIDESAAAQEGLSPDAYAEQVATRWADGLAAQGDGPDDVRALREAADVTIYTPGSTAGVPVNLVGSLRAPALSWDAEEEALRDEIEGTVSGLLGLIGIQADPLASREHVLLSNLVENAWRAGRDLDLATLIGEIQAPPLRKLGVFDTDAFFPPAERTELALRLNGLFASPSFAAWAEGAPLDLQAMLFTPERRPRCAVIYLAHLSDEERQFVVTLVLSRIVTWMRGLPGTADLRALIYMDEVFGFAPPTAAPPAKKPILTILKQARAFGVGMVVSTQNPVDLDYKAMSNAGTWLVGRLQTENDKARVLEGLRSAAGGTDVAALDRALGALQKRQFLMVRAASPEPRLLTTRWVLSYLRGPLTREEVSRLMADAERPTAAVTTQSAPVDDDATTVAPTVADGIAVRHLSPAAPWAGEVGALAGGNRLRAYLAARVALRFDDAAAGLDVAQEWEALLGPLDGDVTALLDTEVRVDYDDRDFGADAPPGAAYVIPDARIGEASFFRDTERALARQLVAEEQLVIQRNRPLELFSRPGERPEEFAARCDAAAQAAADAEAARIRDRLEAKRDRLEAALATAQRRIEDLKEDESSRKQHELIAGAGSVLSALLGGRRSTRSIASAVGSAASRRGVTSRTAQRRESAEEKALDTQEALEELEQEILDEVAEIDEKWRAKAAEIEDVTVRAEAADVRVVDLALVWVPTT